jgi:UTP--glucose-1-phosphate uridylyltransferase
LFRSNEEEISALKAVILAAGLGTRLLPVTKETPKVMLPLFSVGKMCKLCLKSVLHVVFDQLYDVGFREFCFVVGRGKFVIRDYFKPDQGFINYLKECNKREQAIEMEDFYKRVSDSTITFVNQPEMKGKVYGVKLEPHEKRMDIGDAVKYREALNTTYTYFAGEK